MLGASLIIKPDVEMNWEENHALQAKLNVILLSVSRM